MAENFQRPTWRSSIRQFAACLRWWWAAIVTGLILGGLAFWQSLVDTGTLPPALRAPALPAWWLWAGSYVAILIGAVAAFRKMHVEREQIQAQLDATTRPKFSFILHRYIVSQQPQLLTILGSVTNTGAPSVVLSRSWHVRITTINGKHPKLNIAHMAGRTSFKNVDGADLSYEEKQQLHVQAQTPIITGDEVSGPIYCLLKSPLEGDDISKIEIWFQDVMHQTCYFKHSTSLDTEGGPYYYTPGVMVSGHAHPLPESDDLVTP